MSKVVGLEIHRIIKIFSRTDLRDCYLRPVFSGWKKKIPERLSNVSKVTKLLMIVLELETRTLNLGEVNIAFKV